MMILQIYPWVYSSYVSPNTPGKYVAIPLITFEHQTCLTMRDLIKYQLVKWKNVTIDEMTVKYTSNTG